MAAGQHRTKIKVSAQFFSRAYLKYNINGGRMLPLAVLCLENLGSLLWHRLAAPDVDRSGNAVLMVLTFPAETRAGQRDNAPAAG
jgi:hypothetical protein